MAVARHWLFRFSVAANIAVLLYLALYTTSTNYTPTPTSAIDLIGSSNNNNELGQSLEATQRLQQMQLPSSSSSALRNSRDKSTNDLLDAGSSSVDQVDQIDDDAAPPEDFVNRDTSSVDGNSLNNRVVFASASPSPNGIVQSKLFPCDDYTQREHFSQRGPFWILYNYIRATRLFACDESVTYTTHADYTFLDNLLPLVERWQGPVSLSVYSPGTDFDETLNRIMYLRECSSSTLIKEYVTFHLFFDHKHIPKSKIPKNPGVDGANNVNCSAMLKFGENIVTYKKSRKLPYPVNVARNVAREMATTHYVLPSDIELYPNPNLIPDFLDMLRRNDSQLQRPNPKVFVLSIFEVESNVTALPNDKKELVYMLHNKSAIPFHKYVCADCHRIPKANEWIAAEYKPGLSVFHVGKRHKPYHHWEPIFIGTKFDPFYDERLTWEGRSDKMTQGYILCVMDYEFHILDNAFLIHKPGIKRHKVIPKRNPVVARQNTVIAKIILPELKALFGTRPGCFV